MSQLWKEYLKEREGKQVHENMDGFAIYQYVNDVVYLCDIFVPEMKRKEGAASRLADAVAAMSKLDGMNKMVGSVDRKDPSATRNIHVLIHYGMKLVAISGDMLYFEKEL